MRAAPQSYHRRTNKRYSIILRLSSPSRRLTILVGSTPPEGFGLTFSVQSSGCRDYSIFLAGRCFFRKGCS